jgi:hypothetical protein
MPPLLMWEKPGTGTATTKSEKMSNFETVCINLLFTAVGLSHLLSHFKQSRDSFDKKRQSAKSLFGSTLAYSDGK